MLENTLDYMTEFIRQVIENGHIFTHNHMYILLLNLSTHMITDDLAEYLAVIFKEINLSEI